MQDSAKNTITLTAAVERYFQVSLFLLVLTGFGTLAGTGAVDTPTVVLVGMALLARGYFLSRRIEVRLSTRATNLLTLAYGVFYVADYALFSRNFLNATVHLVLFVMVIRLFALDKDRDHYMLAVLAFLMVLAAAVLTVDSVFLFAFTGFMLMAVATFVLMEMHRSSRSANIPAREPTDRVTYRRMAFFLAGTTPILAVLILAGASIIFFLLPRVPPRYLGSYVGGTDLATGFSDHVQLGQIGQIQQSSNVVMHIEIDGDTHGSHDLKWRGVALSQFDGKAWSNPTEPLTPLRAQDGGFQLAPRNPYISPKALQRIHYRVLMEPIGTNIFFLAPRPQILNGVYRSIGTDRAQAVYDLDPIHPISLYAAESDLVEAASPLTAVVPAPPAPDVQPYMQLPPLDARIPALAQQIVKPSDSNFDKAAAIERYLMTQFRYTLDLSGPEPKDPLAEFLFVRKRGHCEYFASSMAILLRTLGIPSRVVNGFRTTEFNDLTAKYVIRASSAHSWVEAYFPDRGWVSFDPTPGSGLEEATGWNRISLYIDAMASFWREWVVNYDSSHQRSLGEDAMQKSRSFLDGLRAWAHRHYASLLERARRTQKTVERSPRRWSALGLLAGLLLFAAANFRNIRRWLLERRLKAHPENAPGQAAALWYQRLLRFLLRQGWNKADTQTPSEFLHRIEDPALRGQVEDFTQAYEAARFGASTEDARRLPGLYEEIAAGEKR
jgi:transglutaminase-like putative cysteine protease